MRKERDLAIVGFLYSSAVRVSELCQLNREDVSSKALTTLLVCSVKREQGSRESVRNARGAFTSAAISGKQKMIMTRHCFVTQRRHISADKSGHPKYFE